MDLILEIIYRKFSIYTSDFEFFARQARQSQLQGEDVDMFIARHQAESMRNKLANRSPTMARKRKSSLSDPPFEDACSSFEEPAKDKMRKEELPMEDAIDMTVEDGKQTG